MAVTLVVVAAFVAFFGVAMKRARARRRAELTEETPKPRPEGEAVAAEERDDAELTREALGQTLSEVDAEAALPAPTALSKGVAAPEPTPAPEAPSSPAVATDEVLARGLAKTTSSFWGKLSDLFARQPAVDASVLNELEEALLTADVGIGLTTRLLDEVRNGINNRTITQAAQVRATLKARLIEALRAAAVTQDPFAADGARPKVVLFVGVNGVGKTTTIGKIAAQLTGQGKSVVLAAGDTFRAAAAEQLTIWGDRTGAKVVRGDTNTDPASVVFNAVNHAIQVNADVLLADTAGRLHTKSNLMDEIKKVKRAAGKAREGAPDHTWLVVDGTTGQNALQQAREFHQALGLDGVILTKLDGTAKGGVVIAIADALKLPVRYVGVGEKATDLRPFCAETFIAALFGDVHS